MATATSDAVATEAVARLSICSDPVRCTKVHSAASPTAMVITLWAAPRSRLRPGSELTRRSTHLFRMRSGAPAEAARVGLGGRTFVMLIDPS